MYKGHFCVWSYIELLLENQIHMEKSHLQFSQRIKFAIVLLLNHW